VPTNIPKQITAGTSVEWIVTLADFKPSDGWLLSYHLRGPSKLDLTHDTPLTDDLNFAVKLTTAKSSLLTAGRYFYQAFVVRGSGDTQEKRLVDNGEIEVLANLSDADEGYDGRSQNEKMLAAIDAMLQKKATRDQQSYTIGQRTLTRIPLDQLLQWRKYYASLVNGERALKRARNGGSFFGNILTQFGDE